MNVQATKKCPFCAEEILAAAIKCKHCGSNLAGPPQSSPTPERPTTRPFFKVLGAIVVIFMVVAIIVAINSPDSSQGTATTSSSSADSSETSQAASVAIPSIESTFIRVVSQARAASDEAQNDMQRGGIKAARDKAICKILTDRAVSGWVGTVTAVDSNSDGKGVLGIQLADHITVSTWNNALSDIDGDTLIQPGTKLFADASRLQSGQVVAFSGTFIPGGEEACITEKSVTLQGGIEDPEFAFKFSSVSANPPTAGQAGS